MEDIQREIDELQQGGDDLIEHLVASQMEWLANLRRIQDADNNRHRPGERHPANPEEDDDVISLPEVLEEVYRELRDGDMVAEEASIRRIGDEDNNIQDTSPVSQEDQPAGSFHTFGPRDLYPIREEIEEELIDNLLHEGANNLQWEVNGSNNSRRNQIYDIDTLSELVESLDTASAATILNEILQDQQRQIESLNRRLQVQADNI